MLAQWAPIFFYVYAAILVCFAFKVVTAPNPIHSALYLVMTMLGLAAAFYDLNAHFIAGVQVIVYAGAVMVLFVIVLMLFDLQQELRAFSKGLISGMLKLMCGALAFGIVADIMVDYSHMSLVEPKAATLAANANLTKDLSVLLYSKYLLAFEVLGVLLLAVAVGVVAVSRVRGGTHAKH
jgi:NADH-quinone oxidoreductase subunit J